MAAVLGTLRGAAQRASRNMMVVSAILEKQQHSVRSIHNGCMLVGKMLKVLDNTKNATRISKSFRKLENARVQRLR